jgi:hypothetical protein
LTNIAETQSELGKRIRTLEDKISDLRRQLNPIPETPQGILIHTHKYPSWSTYDEFTKLPGYPYFEIIHEYPSLPEIIVNHKQYSECKRFLLSSLDRLPVIAYEQCMKSHRTWYDIILAPLSVYYIDSSDDRSYNTSVKIDKTNTRADRVQTYIPYRLHTYIKEYIKGYIATEFRNLMWREILTTIEIDVDSCIITIKAMPPQIPPIKLGSHIPTTYIDHKFATTVSFKIFGVCE